MLKNKSKNSGDNIKISLTGLSKEMFIKTLMHI